MEAIALESSILLRILDVSRRMAERRAFLPLLTYIIDEAMSLAGAERGYVVLVNPDGSLAFRIARDQHGQPVVQAEDQISTSVLRKVVDSGEPLILRDAMEDMNFAAARSVMSLNLRSIICVPLISYGKAIGAIYLENRSVRGRFKEAALTPMVLFANQSAVAIENAVINDDLETLVAARTHELATANNELARSKAELQRRMDDLDQLHAQIHILGIYDALTGLYNGRYLDEQMRMLFAQSARYGQPLTIACADIDSLQRVNDMFSFASGDAVIKQVAQIMRQNLRAADVIVRAGGEEFVVLLPNTGLSEAATCCERIRASIADHNWHAILPGESVTISIGLAKNHGHSAVDQQFQQAKDHLAEAKRGGKNRMVSGNEPAT